MTYIRVKKDKTRETLQAITRQQEKRNLFVNVTVKETKSDETKNTIRIG